MLARRDVCPAGEFLKYYRRIGGRAFSAGMDRNAGLEIAALLLAGEYDAPGGKKVRFLPGGKGDYAGKPFIYLMWTDYVLGPDFQMLTLEGSPKQPGMSAFASIRIAKGATRRCTG